MRYFEKWICKIEKVGFYVKIDKIFYLSWCGCSYNETSYILFGYNICNILCLRRIDAPKSPQWGGTWVKNKCYLFKQKRLLWFFM